MTSVRVYLHNETGQTLVLKGVARQDGSWLGGGAVPAIAPGTVAMTGTKAALPAVFGVQTDGTECELQYEGEYDKTTTYTAHWNNPAIGAKPSVSLDGGVNVSKPQFHVWSDEQHYAFWQAEGRADAVVHFFFRDARTVMTDFRPSNDGFVFNNSGWMDPTPYSLPPLEGTPLDIKFGNAASGLCGGMVFAAMDYFYDQQRIPQTDANPYDPDPLFTYLVHRLFDTFDPKSISLLLALMSSAAADDDESLGEFVDLPCRARVMAYEEWPMIRADLDAGRPSPIVLQTVKSNLPWDLGLCHQVLAYGYEAHAGQVTLFVYDPNNPQDDTITMSFTDNDIGHRIVVTHNVGISEDDGTQLPIYCFIRMNYGLVHPTPTEPRKSTYELANRHLSVVWEKPTPQDEYVDGSGRRTYDIWPDCGTQDLSYTIMRRPTRIGCSFTAYGFYEPEVEVRVGSVSVPLQSLTDYTWAGQTVWQPAPPVPGELGLGDQQTRDIHFRGDGSMRDQQHGGLALTFRPEDGNFPVPVTFTCREKGAAASDDDWTRTFSYIVEGWREDVPGLLEARRECFRKFLDAHRDGELDVAGAAARIELTLPGRRGNPLLDPDPDLVTTLAGLQGIDPLVIQTSQDLQSLPELTAQLETKLREQLEKQKQAPPKEEHGELTPEQIKEQLIREAQEQLKGFPGGG